MAVNYVNCAMKVKQETTDNECTASPKVDEVDKVANQLETVTINGAKSVAYEFHEYLTKRCIKWEYNEVSATGSDHQKLFEIEVTFAGHKFRGTGSQKKLAKQNAAAIAYEAIKKNPSLLPNELQSSSSEKSSVSSVNGDATDNPISKLMEFCAKNKLPPPEFVLIHEYTPPEPPFFKISCIIKLLNIVTEGSGSTKMTAKRSSALAALNEIETKEIFKESPRKAKPKIVEKPNSESLMFMKMKFLEELESIPFDDDIINLLHDKNFDCNTFLLKIANEKIDYLELPKCLNEYRCVCELYIDEHKEIPIFTTWGKSSCSKEEAKNLASRRAIYMIFSSRNS